MKKILMLLLAVLMMFAFVACDNISDSKNPATDVDKAVLEAEKNCTEDVVANDFAISNGIWDFVEKQSVKNEGLGESSVVVIGYYEISDMVKVYPTSGSMEISFMNKDDYNEFKPVANQMMGFTENAIYDDNNLTISETFNSDAFLGDEPTTYDQFINDYLEISSSGVTIKANADNTQYTVVSKREETGSIYNSVIVLTKR